MSFMKPLLTTMGSTAILLSPFGSASAQQVADQIWSGGPILTMDERAMRVDAVAVKDGLVVAVGSRADVMKTRGETTRLQEPLPRVWCQTHH